MNKFFVMLLLIMLLSASASMYADVLGEINHSSGGGTTIIFNSFNFTFTHAEDGGLPMLEEFDLFGPAFVSDIGTTKTISPTTPDFETFTSILTNGTSDFFWHTMGVGGGIGKPEENWINMFVESYGPDLSGYTITEIGLTLNDASLSSPGSNPNGDGIWTDHSYDVTYTFYGELVPEPATLLLLGLGGLMVRRKR